MLRLRRFVRQRRESPKTENKKKKILSGEDNIMYYYKKIANELKCKRHRDSLFTLFDSSLIVMSRTLDGGHLDEIV